ncbi:MAG TPA: hypothetical protein VKI18_05750 [Albitalea sp.]|nr:hypothetical protein [Albitalea sp.]
MIDRHLYKGYLLSYAPMQLDDGRWQARLGIASMSTTKTRAQRFFDLGFFETEADAAAHAQRAGVNWVDDNGASPSATTALSSRGLPYAAR